MESAGLDVREALRGAKRLYLEAAPLIYYVEEDPTYIERMDAIVAQIEDIPLEAVSSVIMLTEVLSQPMKLGRNDLEQMYRNILLNNKWFRLISVTARTADFAAHLRARYHLRTPDALHLATASDAACDLFLTNDRTLKRVSEVRVVVLDELYVRSP